MKLTQLIAQYVKFRKSLGQDFESNERRLRTFSRFVGESADIRSLKPRQVATFLAGSGPITRYWHVKYGALRGFFSYAVTRGYLSVSPLPATVPKQRCALCLTSTPGMSCAASSTAWCPIKNIDPES